MAWQCGYVWEWLHITPQGATMVGVKHGWHLSSEMAFSELSLLVFAIRPNTTIRDKINH